VVVGAERFSSSKVSPAKPSGVHKADPANASPVSGVRSVVPPVLPGFRLAGNSIPQNRPGHTKRAGVLTPSRNPFRDAKTASRKTVRNAKNASRKTVRDARDALCISNSG